MTQNLYESEPYCQSFEATVLETRGDWVFLDRTAFFPGGGGQDSDKGKLNGLQVTEVKAEGGHKVPGHSFESGDKIRAEIDWKRRYDLMRAHTGEHLLFSCITKLNPEIQLVKIGLSPEKKSLIVRGEVDWNLLLNVELMALQAIEQALEVKEVLVEKDDPLLRDTRIKIERIHGDKVRVVEIGEIDRAACAGIHVKNIKEVEMVLVTKLTSARPVGDFEIEFEVGTRAKEAAVRLSWTSSMCSETLGSQPSNLLNALVNLKRESERMEEALKKQGARALSGLEPEAVGGANLFRGCFEGVDKKALAIAAGDMIKEEGTGCVLMTVAERLMLIVACHPSLSIDCLGILNQALSAADGKGGGSRNFASGGASSSVNAKRVFEEAVEGMRKGLWAQGL